MSTFIIAEVGVNHNGSPDLACDLIDVAAEAGADAVKFQTFRAEALVTRSAPKALYQRVSTDPEATQYSMLKELEFDEDDHRRLKEHCELRRVEFLSTPFDLGSLNLLVERLGVRRIKLGSGEITNGPLLLASARTGRPVILSTGMSTLGEVEQALAVLAFGYTNAATQPDAEAFASAYGSEVGRAALRNSVTLLHCTSQYPTPVDDAHLRVMDTLRSAFGLRVGYSDHTLGVVVPIAAVARGAAVIEKHVTMDRTLPGPDHAASLEPDELRALVRAVREVESALGQSLKAPTPGELDTRAASRRSLRAGSGIHQGERFTEENVVARRPAGGVSPMQYWHYMGKQATRRYSTDEPLS